MESGIPLALNGNHLFVPGPSSAMRTLERMISDIAPTSIPVLLVGESGTGKEVVAVHLHRLSSRAHQAIVKFNCAAMGAEAIHEFGSAREGRSEGSIKEQHAPGTIFLDEVSELSPLAQQRLLHSIPENVEPSEGISPRVICATSRNLEEELRAGRFREELYYRLNGVCLRLSPLRQRREDIPALVNFFLTKYAAVYERPRPVLSAAAMDVFGAHDWPGNVRELENVVKKIVALGSETPVLEELSAPRPRREIRRNGRARAEDLAHAVGSSAPGEGISLKEAARAASRSAERDLILKTLAQTRWNRKRAAEQLRISYKALLYKMKEIGLADPPAA